MKLSKYAKQLGISYQTAWNLYKQNKIPNAYKLSSGTIIIPEEPALISDYPKQVLLYARVSSNQQKDDLDRQVIRLESYAIAKGYTIYKTVKEIGSGLNDNRPLLNKSLFDKNYNILIIEHKDRLTRFGFNYINFLFQEQNRNIEIINMQDMKDDIMQDFVSIITSFCARIYGQRKSKRKTEQIIKELNNNV